MKKLRVGIIGCGRISVMHFISAQVLDGAELVACCDTKLDRAEKMAERFGTRAYLDYKEMLSTENLDVVHICLPHYLHVPVSMYAMERGIHVICEKPMSIDYDSAASAVECAEKNGVQYGIVFQCRYNSSIQFVKKAVESGKLGRIISARSILTWARPDSYYAESDWKGTWDKEGGGVVIDQAIHSIDLVNWMVDSEIDSLSCSMANRGHKQVDVEDSAEGLITYKNGTVYGFYCMNNYGCTEPIEIKLFCEKGKVTFGYTDAYIVYNDGTCEEAHADTHSRLEEYGEDYWGCRHINQIEQFYKACLGEETLELSGREALKTQELVCRIYECGGMRK